MASARLPLLFMGFCGIDDSVPAGLLCMLSSRYPWIEWGVLFRTDMEGEPRYATPAYMDELCGLNARLHGKLNLAGHLCGNRCQQVLDGDFSFVETLLEKGFRRVQVNATAANGVLINSDTISLYVDNLKKCMQAVPRMEFIIQCNDETKPIWEPLLSSPEENMSVLHDASCGMGVMVSSFPLPSPVVPCGYAGGIGPDSIRAILEVVTNISKTNLDCRPVWIDMESSLRQFVVTKATSGGATVTVDTFSIQKCFQCAEIAATIYGLPSYN
jgi:hypothetical protein